MVIEAAFVAVLAAALAGLVLSSAIERLMTPRPPVVRPWSAWALHGGLWLSAHAALTLVLGRPWFAAAAVSAFLLMLVLVNNAKFKALREPFVFPDYEYFTDAIRHPRLYIPFLGWGKFFIATSGFVLAVAVGLWIEDAPLLRFAWSGQLGGIAVVFAGGALLLLAGSWKTLPVSFEPVRDAHALGLLASLWRYAQEEGAPLAIASPFDFLSAGRPEGDLPHLVAVQSESFFDPRPLFAGIRPEVLAEFDRIRADAVALGKLKVPAWGANTVRTEFAFLTGIGEDKLGVHRFNPYRAIAAGGDVPSLASYLKRLGYRTVCIHPYPASFYQRDRVYPHLGFDEFLDVCAFDDTMRFGPYIGDAAVADKVAELLRETTGPVFVFVITMENHGPLHLERVAPADVDVLYSVPPPDGCDDLTIYLRHLRNADQMIAKLRQALDRCERPASLCWFGDHVPIMPSVYETFGAPNGEVEYVFWSNQNPARPRSVDLVANDLPMAWLRDIGLVELR
ncbi:LTA synthase family protein [Laribacter hongkongensis]|uniref:LTA synthase family protein n=1 Tax=Laribacter hongkongensis TaxID=168471 RepID=A0ABD4SX23_9NEIS|nr:LTA synthase family protein [Laribacter hongkongensis]MCG9027136.1 LTA synthase family protein [Laribacter hongkongensis]MCG9056345.1 LTA synthase family protein [Laribacter hongkongensis]MCG9116338.1 LTA synthase family protein [Laribacter hongkongensis]MCG9125569.1 LTA synthase family protein [Laribacter hongkongensis]